MNIKIFANKYGSTILTFASMGGVVMTAITAVNAKTKAEQLLEDRYISKYAEDNDLPYEKAADILYTCDSNFAPPEPLNAKESVEATWKAWIIPVASGVLTCAMIFGAHKLDGVQKIAMSATCQALETALHSTQKRLRDAVGEEEYHKIQEKVSEEAVKEAVLNDKEPQKFIEAAPNGLYWCFDRFSGRAFLSNREKIEHAVNEINKKVLDELYSTVNEFYDEIEFTSPCTSLSHISAGDSLGWGVELPANRLIVEYYDTHLPDSNIPCLAIDYEFSNCPF